MVAIAPVRPVQSTDFVSHVQSILLAANAAAKDAETSEDRRMFYRIKDQLLNYVIETRAASTGPVRVSGQNDRGRATVIVTLETRRQTRNFHMPVDCLTLKARFSAADALGPLARSFGLY